MAKSALPSSKKQNFISSNVQTAPGLSHSGVTRPHLRNLFFRTHTLLSLDILPVIVLDGVCPEAKSATVQARKKVSGLQILVFGHQVPCHQSYVRLGPIAKCTDVVDIGSIQARNRARGAGGFESPKRQHRRQFKGVLNDCLRLAESLGVPCVRQVHLIVHRVRVEVAKF